MPYAIKGKSWHVVDGLFCILGTQLLVSFSLVTTPSLDTARVGMGLAIRWR